MVNLLQDIDKLQILTRIEVSKFTIDRFHPDKIVDKYERLLLTL